MKQVQVDSICVLSVGHGWHYWMMYEHSADWRWCRAICTRCGCETHGSNALFEVVRENINRYWEGLQSKRA